MEALHLGLTLIIKSLMSINYLTLINCQLSLALTVGLGNLMETHAYVRLFLGKNPEVALQ